MSVQPMTKATEKRILSALDATTAGVESGLAPTEAVVKAARDARLAPGHVPLLVRAFNVASATRHRKEAATREEKAQPYPMADADEAARLLYGQSTAKAAAAPDSSYALAPSWYAPEPALRKRMEERSFAKAASEAPRPTPVVTPEDEFIQKRAYADRLGREVSNLGQLLQLERDSRNACLDKLATALITPGRPAYADVRSTARLALGEVAATALDALAEKDASVRDRKPLRKLVPASDPVIGLLKAAIDHARHVVALEVTLSDLRPALERAKKACYTRPGANEQALLPLERFLVAKEAEGKGLVDSVSAGLGAASGGNMANMIANQLRSGHDSAIKGVLDQIATPAHEQELRGIRTASMLSDLLQNDPVVAAHADPVDVSNTFNQLGEFAPRLADQPLVMQAMLRKSLQAPLEPFDIQALGKTDHENAGRGYVRPVRPEGQNMDPYFATGGTTAYNFTRDQASGVNPVGHAKDRAKDLLGIKSPATDKAPAKPGKPDKGDKPDKATKPDAKSPDNPLS